MFRRVLLLSLLSLAIPGTTWGQTYLGAESDDNGEWITNIRLEIHAGTFPGKIPAGYSVTGQIKTASVRWTRGRGTPATTRVWTVPAIFEGQRYMIFAHDGKGAIETIVATYRRHPIQFDEGCGAGWVTYPDGRYRDWMVWVYDETP